MHEIILAAVTWQICRSACKMINMGSSLLKSALKLSKPEKILLVEQIWDGLASEQDAPALSADQEAMLDRRLNRLDRTGPLGSSWDNVKRRLGKRSA